MICIILALLISDVWTLLDIVNIAKKNILIGYIETCISFKATLKQYVSWSYVEWLPSSVCLEKIRQLIVVCVMIYLFAD